MTTAKLLALHSDPIVVTDGVTEKRKHRIVPRGIRLDVHRDAIDVTPNPAPGDRHRRMEAGDLRVWLCVPVPVWVLRISDWMRT